MVPLNLQESETIDPFMFLALPIPKIQADCFGCVPFMECVKLMTDKTSLNSWYTPALFHIALIA